MQTIKVTKLELNEILNLDAFRWKFLNASTKSGWQTYQKESPLEDALRAFRCRRDS